jgi:tyrosyl-DNA phosphodiesterase-1
MIPPAGNIGAITFQEMVAGCTWDFATLSNYMIDPMWLMSQWPGLADIPRIDIFHGCDALDQRQFRGFLPPHAELHNRVPKKLTFRHRRTGVVWNNTYGCHHSKFLLLGNARGIRVIITTANFLQSDFDLKTQVRSCRSTA